MPPVKAVSRTPAPSPAASINAAKFAESAPAAAPVSSDLSPAADLGLAKTLYRVVRPILHGTKPIAVNTLVNMHPSKAQHLVETGALIAHYVPKVVSEVVDVEETIAEAVGAARASNAEGAIAAAVELAGQVETDPTKIEAAAAEDRAEAKAAAGLS